MSFDFLALNVCVITTVKFEHCSHAFTATTTTTTTAAAAAAADPPPPPTTTTATIN